ncbi:MAG: hypothetical protein LBO67_08645 [Spirochaetaceae bacterium]|jgi:hypothetical protein|nr:hypothetical protein [Spirochaetaceae bacterium]
MARYTVLICTALIRAALPVFAQEPYQIPQTVYVGDRALLVVPLATEATSGWEQRADLPVAPYLHIHRIAAGKGQLTVDFTAFSPGLIAVPAFTVPAVGTITGLHVNIASILEGSSPLLAPTAPPLPVPGTSALLYSIIAGTLILSFIFVLSKEWRKRCLRRLLKKLLQYYLIFKMNRLLISLHKSASVCPDLHKALYTLHTEIRSFVSRITGIDCRCLSVSEIRPVLGTELAALINQCDTLRFAGFAVNVTEFCAFIDAVQRYVHTVQNNS